MKGGAEAGERAIPKMYSANKIVHKSRAPHSLNHHTSLVSGQQRN